MSPAWCGFLAWTLADVGVAWAVARVADRRERGKLLEDEGEQRWTGSRIATLWVQSCFHDQPRLLLKCRLSGAGTYAILSRSQRPSPVRAWFSRTCVSPSLSNQPSRVSEVVHSSTRSSSLIRLFFAGSLLSAVFLLSLATHLSLHPILLLPPLILLSNQLQSPAQPRRSLRTDVVRGVLAFAAHQAILLSASRWYTGSWDFLSTVYGLMYASAQYRYLTVTKH